jgi:hypothetical protein
MKLPPPKTPKSCPELTTDKARTANALFAWVEPVSDLVRGLARSLLLPRGRRTRPKARVSRQAHNAIFQQLEPRELLYGYIMLQNQPQYGWDTALNTQTYSVAAPGVLSGASGGTAP